MKTILFIHQSSELYGSDKALLYLVKKLSMNSTFNIIVVIPEDGPLKKALQRHKIEVIISPVAKVSRKMFSIWNILLMPFWVLNSIWKLYKEIGKRKIDIIHSNTLAVLLGAFYSKLFRIKHIWHVHEIVTEPKLVKRIYTFLLNHFTDQVIFNSKATQKSYVENNERLEQKAVIILNGLNRDEGVLSPLEIKKLRQNLYKATNDDIVIGLVGRINSMKGHHLLIDAFCQLINTHHNIRLVFVGSVSPGEDFLLENLKNSIKQKGIKDRCELIPFQDNIWNIWDSIDIATIPSTKPESFGLVAIEAMLSSKPVIASNHGGLVEIILHGETGYLFVPNNVEDLRYKLEKLIEDSKKRIDFGVNGMTRAQNSFSLNSYTKKFIQLYLEM